jgi:hypothetical protein
MAMKSYRRDAGDEERRLARRLRRLHRGGLVPWELIPACWSPALTAYTTGVLVTLLAMPASGCPFCESATAEQVRAELFNQQFFSTLAVVLLPFPILLALVAAIAWCGTDARPSGRTAAVIGSTPGISSDTLKLKTVGRRWKTSHPQEQP